MAKSRRRVWRRGDVIPNGATLLVVGEPDHDGFMVVLAFSSSHDYEFAVWTMSEDGGCTSGDYSQSIQGAVAAYERRSK